MILTEVASYQLMDTSMMNFHRDANKETHFIILALGFKSSQRAKFTAIVIPRLPVELLLDLHVGHISIKSRFRITPVCAHITAHMESLHIIQKYSKKAVSLINIAISSRIAVLAHILRSY